MEQGPTIELMEIYRLRGWYISDACHVEDWLDIAIAVYFGVDVRDIDFRTWILGRLSTQGKVDVVRRIAEEAQMRDDLASVVSALQWMTDTRNGISHARVTMEWVDDFDRLADDAPFWRTIRNSRKGVRPERVDVEQLNSDVDRVVNLVQHAQSLVSAFHALRQGGDPKKALREHREVQQLGEP